jgi:WD40 repeat protein
MHRGRGSYRFILCVLTASCIAAISASEDSSRYAAWGTGSDFFGGSGIVVAGSGNDIEIYGAGVQAGSNFWSALRYQSSTHEYVQTFLSEDLGKAITQVALLKTTSNERPLLIVVALQDGTLRLYDRTTKKLLDTQAGPCVAHSGLVAMATHDIDGDGWDEFVSACSDGSVSVHGYSYGAWLLSQTDYPPIGDVAVGQMDDDPAVEIAIGDGRVIDTSTRTVQWSRPVIGGAFLQVVDIDSDGRDELISAGTWGAIEAFDVETQELKWSLPKGVRYFEGLLVEDIDGDGGLELVSGEREGNKLHVFDLETLTEEWSITGDFRGTSAVVAMDLTNDGIKELLWAYGTLKIVSPLERTILWQSPSLRGPFVGPSEGDLDGDGVPEIVFAASTSNDVFGGGRLVVIDSRTLQVRAISSPVLTGAIQDVKVRDVDGDARLDIIAATGEQIVAFGFNAENVFSKIWTNFEPGPFAEHFLSVEVGDLDFDGKPDVVAGLASRMELFVVFDAETRIEKWRTERVDYWANASRLVLAQIDDDPQLEVIGLSESGSVYVFDGLTHEKEAIVTTSATSISALDPHLGIGTLLIGDRTGHVGAWRYSGTTYTETIGWGFGTKPIDGAHVTSAGALVVGSDGMLTIRREASAVQSVRYGQRLGRDVLSFRNGRALLTAGGFGLHAFIARQPD